jgi:hypothetical protein
MIRRLEVIDLIETVDIAVWDSADANERLCKIMGERIAKALLEAGALVLVRSSFNDEDRVTVTATIAAAKHCDVWPGSI